MEPLEKACCQKFTEERAEVFFEVLQDLRPGQLFLAVRKHLATSENAFLPMPGTLRRLALETSEQPIDAETAWGALARMIRGYGYYRESEALEAMDEATRHAVLCCGGWQQLCDMTEDTRGHYRKCFRDGYEHFQERRTEERLSGIPHMIPEAQARMLDAAGYSRAIGEGPRRPLLEGPPPRRIVENAAKALALPEPVVKPPRSEEQVISESRAAKERQLAALRAMKPVLEAK